MDKSKGLTAAVITRRNKTMVKVIIREGIIQDVLSTEPVEIEIIDLNKDYEDYDKLCEYESKLYADETLKSQDFTVVHFGEEDGQG